MLNLKNRSIAGSFAIVATMITVAAATPLRAEAPSARVAYADLDLGTQAGVDMLNSRIQRAASHVCSDNSGNHIAEANCRSKAVASAQSQVASVTRTDGIQLAAR
jgi:UrcA family protein